MVTRISLILYLKVILCSLVKLFINQITYNIQPDENIYLNDFFYSKNVEDEQNIQNVNNFDVQLLKEINLKNQLSLELNGNEKLFSFNLGNNDDVDILLLNNRSINCLYQAKNYMQDDEIIIKQNNCEITLNQSNCFQLHQLDYQMYIVQCYFDLNNTIIQILNQSKIFDEIIIPIQPKCQPDSILVNTILTIYDKNCQTSIFYSLNIQNLSFQNFIKNDLKEFEGFIENKQELIEIQSTYFHNLYFIYVDSVWVLNQQTNNLYLTLSYPEYKIKNLYIYKRQSMSHVTFENTETQQLYMDYNELNLSSVNFKNSYFIKINFIVLYFTDKLSVQYKNYSNILYTQINNLVRIGDLPCFIAQKKSQFTLIKLILPKLTISYNNSNFLLINKFKSNQNISLIKLTLSDPNHPVQHFRNTIFHKKINLNHSICLSYDQYQRAHPIKLKQIMINGKKQEFIYKQRGQIITFSNKIIYSRIYFLKKLNDEIILVGIIKGNNSFQLFYYQNGIQLQSYKLKLFDNLIKIFFIEEYMALTIIYQNQIEIYQLSLNDVKKQIFNTKLKLNQAIIYQSKISYLLDDCTNVEIRFLRNNIIQQQIMSKLECKSCFHFVSDNLCSDNYSIFYTPKSYYNQRITLKQKIVEISNIFYLYFLVFTYDNNEYNVKLFQTQFDELFLLFTLPTYNYTLVYPFQYKYFQQILIIKARSLNQEYLLIYNLQNIASESLIQITEIDVGEQSSFDFLNEKEYFYFYQKQLYIQTINNPCFTLPSLKKLQDSIQTFIQDVFLQITTESLLNKQSFDLDVHLQSINQNYTLQLRNLYQNILTENIINVENIFGNIEDVQIIGSQNVNIQLPLIFRNNSYVCSLYRFGICLNESSITTNIFDQNSWVYHINQIRNIRYIGFNQNDCTHSFYQIQDIQLNFYEFNFVKNNQELIKNHKTFNTSLSKNLLEFKQINNLQIIFVWIDSVSILFKYKKLQNEEQLFPLSQIKFRLFDGIEISQFTYILLSIKGDLLDIRLLKFTEANELALFDILLFKQYQLSALLEDLKMQIQEIQPYQIKIYQLKNIINKVEIYFIIIFQEQFSLLMKMTLDSNSLQDIAFEQLGIIRYEQSAIFHSLLFLDHNNAIFVFNIFDNKFVNIFDISNIKKHEVVDSIQRFKDNNYTVIERYNVSHFVIVEEHLNYQFQIYSIVNLITLDKLKVECIGKCSNKAQLKLSNKVSEILIQLKFNNESFWQCFIVVFTLISILIKLYLKRLIKSKEKNFQS